MDSVVNGSFSPEQTGSDTPALFFSLPEATVGHG